MTAESFLDAVDALDAAATPGRWVRNDWSHGPDRPVIEITVDSYADDVENAEEVAVLSPLPLAGANAAFIAAARTDLPRLAAFARAVLDGYREYVSHSAETGDLCPEPRR